MNDVAGRCWVYHIYVPTYPVAVARPVPRVQICGVRFECLVAFDFLLGELGKLQVRVQMKPAAAALDLQIASSSLLLSYATDWSHLGWDHMHIVLH